MNAMTPLERIAAVNAHLAAGEDAAAVTLLNESRLPSTTIQFKTGPANQGVYVEDPKTGLNLMRLHRGQDGAISEVTAATMGDPEMVKKYNASHVRMENGHSVQADLGRTFLGLAANARGDAPGETVTAFKGLMEKTGGRVERIASTDLDYKHDRVKDSGYNLQTDRRLTFTEIMKHGDPSEAANFLNAHARQGNAVTFQADENGLNAKDAGSQEQLMQLSQSAARGPFSRAVVAVASPNVQTRFDAKYVGAEGLSAGIQESLARAVFSMSQVGQVSGGAKSFVEDAFMGMAERSNVRVTRQPGGFSKTP